MALPQVGTKCCLLQKMVFCWYDKVRGRIPLSRENVINEKRPSKKYQGGYPQEFPSDISNSFLLGKAIAVLEISIYLSGNENFTEKTKKVNERRAVLLFYISSTYVETVYNINFAWLSYFSYCSDFMVIQSFGFFFSHYVPLPCVVRHYRLDLVFCGNSKKGHILETNSTLLINKNNLGLHSLQQVPWSCKNLALIR